LGGEIHNKNMKKFSFMFGKTRKKNKEIMKKGKKEARTGSIEGMKRE
jgi:hypothetical protein